MQLPDSTAPNLSLCHPTLAERYATWTLNSKTWGTALGLKPYLDRELHMATTPLTRDGGLTYWILVDRHSPPDSRAILGSMETIRKRALVAKNGQVKEVITHGIGSVFCNPEYRGRGYAGRMLREAGHTLKSWQTDKDIPGREECEFSFLYSDIGKKYYAKHGWLPFPSTHIFFPASTPSAAKNGASTTNGYTNGISETAALLKSEDIEALCALDETYIRKKLAQVKDCETHVALIPDHSTMQWHHMREDFVTSHLFPKTPTTRGAIAGTPGKRVWAIWTRSFYGPVDKVESGNTLHFLRLVVEDEVDVEGNTVKLRAIVSMAQREAAEWKCKGVEMWNPTRGVRELVEGMGLEHREVEREAESIASLMWYGEGRGEDLVWVGNEKFGWC